MITIPSTTLVCIDCVNHAAALRALTLSLRQCDFDDAILFTDRDMSAPGIRTVIIPRITSKEMYSDFLFKALYRHIDSDFVLVIQWDGYVVDASRWSSSFQQYDYIGAAWPWLEPARRIGNGGFSLRSRKLLAALQEPQYLSGHPEDEVLCQAYRIALERDHDIFFADEVTAAKFAFERAEPTQATFGFHGLFNMGRFVPDAELASVLDMVSDYVALSPEMMDLLLWYFRNDRMAAAAITLARIERLTTPETLVDLVTGALEAPFLARALLRAVKAAA